MKLFFIGYPADIGGASTEAWHTIKLWRQHGVDVHLIPTWGHDGAWKNRLDALGCVTHHVRPEELDQVPGLAGSPVVSLCNSEFLVHAARFRKLGCPLIWVNCMTFLFDAEKKFYAQHGPMDAMVYQSEFQRSQLEPLLKPYGYSPASGHLIRGAFDAGEWTFQPRPHAKDEVFTVGRAARPDPDKWSSNTWPIYEKICYRRKRALMLGMDERRHKKLGSAPGWADCLKPLALSAQHFFACLHCNLPVNGGARENWPRVGLEAMACGVPVVAQNQWGWKEMIEHGVTGFLGDCDEEMAHYVAMSAYDEELRQRIIKQAHERLLMELANPDFIWASWQRLFDSLASAKVAA